MEHKCLVIYYGELEQKLVSSSYILDKINISNAICVSLNYYKNIRSKMIITF